MRRLRETQSLEQWLLSVERRLTRQEQRGQTTLVTEPATTRVAVATTSDIPELDEPENVEVWVMDTNEWVSFDPVARTWSSTP